MIDHAALATLLDNAQRNARSIPPLTDQFPLVLDDSYEIQRRIVARRLARGERPTGVKMGFTSEAMRRQMNIDHANWGLLTDVMEIRRGEALDMARFIHPRVEPEVCFRLRRDLTPPFTADDVRAAIDAVAPAIEVVDTRYHEYRFKLEDNTADNSSAAGYVLGDWAVMAGDCSKLNVGMVIDGTQVTAGNTADVMGDPLLSLVEAARMAAEGGQPLRRSWVVLTGGATASVPLKPGCRVVVQFDGLGKVSLDVGI